MKIIFSRKGFDSSYGGGASPILPDGRLLSIPIPAGDGEKGIPYKQLEYEKDRNYEQLMLELGLKIPDTGLCHLDPDLDKGTLKRNEDWRPIFGQHGAANKHLFNRLVEPGDIFLFFGSFKRTCFDYQGKLRFEKDYERHIIFGYLKIADVFQLGGMSPEELKGCEQKLNWALEHPHFQNNYGKENAVFISGGNNEQSQYKAGTFKYDDSLVLTRTGFPKSQWELPDFFHPSFGTEISRHANEKKFRLTNGHCQIQTVGIGQDFVVKGSEEIENWALELIENAEVT
ncbi:hypothetical protein QQ008_08735 [Fulvivirgaceae bacterium BMA10]|uniref:Nucleotide modification associated domain-containing protein n=1 Tax=Splendidivirga corallicola TaxID=3051826 RepID=A0ABT8KL48_9BACT|nr:hypothetical protein [Fulvivirgaceae bacterium BMA10]